MAGVEGDGVYKMVSSNSEEILCTHLCMCVCVSLYIMKLGQRERDREEMIEQRNQNVKIG